MSNRSPLLNVIFQSLNKVTRSMLRDFGEIENLQVSTKGPGDFVSSADKRTEKITMNHSKSDVTLNDITNFILNNKIIKITSI